MLITGFAAGSFGTNCYLIAPEPGGPCLIIDPGQSSLDPLDRIVREHRLTPEAVLITHGHMDHTWDAAAVGLRYQVPVLVHEADRFMLSDPAAALPATFPQRLLAGYPNAEPADVRPLTQTTVLHLAGLEIDALHSPGHTAGSVMYLVRGDDPVLFTGDLLLAGELGRADLPGGSQAELEDSLRHGCGPLSGSTVILPGHGPGTTVAAERGRYPGLFNPES